MKLPISDLQRWSVTFALDSKASELEQIRLRRSALRLKRICSDSFRTLNEITERPSIAFRRPNSLRDLLVRAKLKPDTRDDESPLGEKRPCSKARCKTCKMITPHRWRSQRLGQSSSLVAPLVVRRPMLSTL